MPPSGSTWTSPEPGRRVRRPPLSSNGRCGKASAPGKVNEPDPAKATDSQPPGFIPAGTGTEWPDDRSLAARMHGGRC